MLTPSATATFTAVTSTPSTPLGPMGPNDVSRRTGVYQLLFFFFFMTGKVIFLLFIYLVMFSRSDLHSENAEILDNVETLPPTIWTASYLG